MTPALRSWLRLDVLAATACANIVGLALPIAVLQVYDRVLRSANTATLAYIALGVGLALAIELALRIARANMIANAAARYEHQATTSVFASILGDPQTPALDPGKAVEGVKDVARVRDGYFGPSASALLDVPFAAIAIALIGVIAGPLVVIPLTAVVITMVATFALSKSLNAETQKQNALDQRRFNFLYEVVTGHHTVRALAAENDVSRRHERLQAGSAMGVERITFLNGLVRAATMSSASATTAMIIVVGAALALSGNLTVGGLAAATMLAARTMQPVARSAVAWKSFAVSRTAVERLTALQPNAKPAPSRQAEWPAPIMGELRLHRACLTPAPGFPPLIVDGHLCARPNSVTGVIGAPGSGKTTLLRALAGERALDEGVAALDGVPITNENAQAFQRHVALIAPDAGLVSGTLLDNVTMHRRGEYPARALKAIDAVGLRRVVARLPDGLNTIINAADAQSLPPGVVQRVYIARALVDEPKLILLDQANAGLDAESDEALRQLIASLGKIATVIMVSSRPSYLRLCDEIYEIANRTLHLRGTPDAALSTSSPDLAQPLTAKGALS